MPRIGGPSNQIKRIRQKIARIKGIRTSDVRSNVVLGRLKVRRQRLGKTGPGIKIKLYPGETLKSAFNRFKKAKKYDL